MTETQPTETQPRVVVIGGGYAGVMAANRLMSRDDLAVTLVNPRPHFVERIRLHQIVAGNHDAAVPYDRILNAGVHVLVDSVARIDVADRSLALASGATLDYDYLVYAAGSTGAAPAAVPGAAEFAHPISEWEQAVTLRDRLADVAMSAPVVVVGAGLTGIEAAAELAEAGRPVTLVSAQVGPSLSRPGRRSVIRRLTTLGVTMVEGATVAAVGPDHVLLSDGRRLASAATVWSAGFGVPPLAAQSGLTTDGMGRLVTDETYTSVDDDHIVAAGDAAAPSRQPYRMSCQASLPMGVLAADTVLARLAGEHPSQRSVPMTAQCISLGRRAGTLQLQRRDDTPVPVFVGGRAGAFIKEQVCRWTVKWMAGEAATPGSYRSLRGPERTAPAPETVASR
ncbi:FAD-dependent oxidoreductase [Mycolicibacterium sp. 018/SC-01/001]|uniref:NAD(P)/FAD-dependent oxidoreductase n=1 Tax=Mycolicibacterium sp. 018/SC-01/001 TaxID=2592069 RepID=UPI00117FABC4|nr:FAD-dependent oxidoreductase [Mycolicibacterium sp. 018/SC-01/001]TRW78296.1 FAD-dependent oxidoreductase [Mycolicibacterium sp. 018/SC-01/001]